MKPSKDGIHYVVRVITDGAVWDYSTTPPHKLGSLSAEALRDRRVMYAEAEAIARAAGLFPA